MDSDGLIIDCMCVSVVESGPVTGCEGGEEGMVRGRLDGVGDRVSTRELPLEDIVGPACAAVADDCGETGDDVSGKLVGSTEGNWMKAPVVDTGMGVVVTGASGNVGGMESGTTSRLVGSIVIRDVAIGSQQQQKIYV